MGGVFFLGGERGGFGKGMREEGFSSRLFEKEKVLVIRLEGGGFFFFDVAIRHCGLDVEKFFILGPI